MSNTIYGTLSPKLSINGLISVGKGDKGDPGYVPPMYDYIKEVPDEDYLFEIGYTDLDYDNAKEYFDKKQPIIPVFGCTSVRSGYLYGRNFDWIYYNNAEFVVKTVGKLNTYSTLGISSSLNLTPEFVKSGEESELYKIVPFILVDGINECGLTMNVNVVPQDKGITYGTTPVIEQKEKLCSTMVIRYVLDHFSSASEAVEFLENYVSIYTPQTLIYMGYEQHYMIADKDKTFIIEFIENEMNVLDVTDKPYMTNFHLTDVTFDNNGKVIINRDGSNENESGVTLNGSGLERYNFIAERYNNITSFIDIKQIMDALHYTNAYDLNTDWYTEFVGINGLNVTSPIEDYTSVIEAANYKYEHRSRDKEDENYGTWQTTHTSIFDIDECTLSLESQESILLSVFTIPSGSENSINALKQDISNLKGRVNALEEEIEDLGALDLSELQEKIDTIEEQIESLDGYDDTEIKADIEDIKEQLSNIETYDDTEIKSDIEDIKNQLSQIEEYDDTEIKADISSLEEQVSNIQPYDDTEIKSDIEEAISIAKGRSTGYVFDTVDDLDEALLDSNFVNQLVVGDNLYIIDIDVPDYWWDGEQKQQLESQKVDLTEYATKSELENYASKSELSTYATKSELNSYATKAELNNYVTDSDLENYVLNSDLDNYATKSELSNFVTDSDLENYATKSELGDYLTESDLDNYATKTYADNKVDSVVSGVDIRFNSVENRIEWKERGADTFHPFNTGGGGESTFEPYTLKIKSDAVNVGHTVVASQVGQQSVSSVLQEDLEDETISSAILKPKWSGEWTITDTTSGVSNIVDLSYFGDYQKDVGFLHKYETPTNYRGDSIYPYSDVYKIQNVFDGNYTSMWLPGVNIGATYIDFDYGEIRAVKYIEIVYGTMMTVPRPSVRLLGRNNENDAWENISDSVDMPNGVGTSNAQVVFMNNNTLYKYYRILYSGTLCRNTSAGSYTGVADVAIYGY